MTRHEVATTRHQSRRANEVPTWTATVFFDRQEMGLHERRTIGETGFYWTQEECLAAAFELMREKGVFCGCSLCRRAIPAPLRKGE
jgi:hypothetical protein